MAMTTLQTMASRDALKRLLSENKDVYDAFIESASDTVLTYGPIDGSFIWPTDKEIKGGGYEGAVDSIYQQIIAAVKTNG